MGFVVSDTGLQAVVQLAEELVEQVALGLAVPVSASNYRRDAPRLSLGVTHRTICRRHLGVSQSGARHAETSINLQSQRND